MITKADIRALPAKVLHELLRRGVFFFFWYLYDNFAMHVNASIRNSILIQKPFSNININTKILFV